MTVLEAAAADVPVLARDIPSLRALGVAPLWRTVPELLAMLDALPEGDAFQLARRATAELAARHTLENLRAGIWSAYRAAAPPPPFGIEGSAGVTSIGEMGTIGAFSSET